MYIRVRESIAFPALFAVNSFTEVVARAKAGESKLFYCLKRKKEIPIAPLKPAFAMTALKILEIFEYDGRKRLTSVEIK